MYKWRKKIIIKRIILKYYALNRIHVSRKFLTSNPYDESTNNVSSRFASAHWNNNKERGYVRQVETCLDTNPISWKHNVIRIVSSLEQNTNDRSKKVNSKHTRETLHTIYTYVYSEKYTTLNNSISRNDTNRKNFF